MVKKEKIGYNDLLVRLTIEHRKRNPLPFTSKDIQEEATELKVDSNILHLVDNGTIIAFLNEEEELSYCHKDNWKEIKEK